MHTVVPTYRHITSTIKQNVAFLEGVVSSNTAHGEVYSMQHYVNKFVSDMQQVSDHHDLTEILLKVALNTINLKPS